MQDIITSFDDFVVAVDLGCQHIFDKRHVECGFDRRVIVQNQRTEIGKQA